MKIIVFYGCNTFGEDYQFFRVCNESEIDGVIANVKNGCTEVYDHKVYDCEKLYYLDYNRYDEYKRLHRELDSLYNR